MCAGAERSICVRVYIHMLVYLCGYIYIYIYTCARTHKIHTYTHTYAYVHMQHCPMHGQHAQEKNDDMAVQSVQENREAANEASGGHVHDDNDENNTQVCTYIYTCMHTD